ncbi:MAG: hypothetical protein QM736_03095 [Vicinamibacterales bacterium]
MSGCMPTNTYLNSSTTLISWLLTSDHKRIALLYIAGITFFFGIGGIFATLIRLELVTPAGDLMTDRDIQQGLHDARHHHGVLLPHPARFPRCSATSCSR